MFDIYEAVTDRIIAAMEEGNIPWQKPWVFNGGKVEKVDSRVIAVNHVSGKPYSLLNQMLLGRPGEYVSFKQCQEAGGRVKKGEKSSMVVFWKWIETEDEETHEKKEVPFLRYYSVFHIDQCEGLRAKHTKPMLSFSATLPSIKDSKAWELMIKTALQKSLPQLKKFSQILPSNTEKS